MSIEWEVADSSTCPGRLATVNGHTVFVSIFDEGPMTAAYFWQIDDKRGVHDGVWFDGWAPTITQAKRDAVKAARAMEPA